MHYIDTPRFNFNLIAGQKQGVMHPCRPNWDVQEQNRLNKLRAKPRMDGGMMGSIQLFIELHKLDQARRAA